MVFPITGSPMGSEADEQPHTMALPQPHATAGSILFFI